ncbi:MAG: hypothetical protein INR73_16010 [Williamsia sp.]|nr:hypothetical protein [Williamsia sp.]
MPALSLAEWGMFLFFSMYLLVSAVCQIPGKWTDQIRKWDYLNLVPAWSFFAPNPATHDLHLLIRDQLVDGSLSRWKEILPSKPHRFLSVVWNPGRRHTKAFFDIIKNFALVVKANGEKPELVMLSLPYLAILNYVSHLPREHQSCKTQFLVMRTERLTRSGATENDPFVVFLSSLHSLEDTLV